MSSLPLLRQRSRQSFLSIEVLCTILDSLIAQPQLTPSDSQPGLDSCSHIDAKPQRFDAKFPDSVISWHLKSHAVLMYMETVCLSTDSLIIIGPLYGWDMEMRRFRRDRLWDED